MLTRTLACSLAVVGLVASAPLAQAAAPDAGGHYGSTKVLPLNGKDFLFVTPNGRKIIRQFQPQNSEYQREIQPVKVGDYYLGLSLDRVSDALRSHLRLEDNQGVMVMSVLDDSSAGEAGLQQYDVLTHVGDEWITGHEMLVDAIQKAGDEDRELALTYLRAGDTETVSLRPMKRDSQNLAKSDDSNDAEPNHAAEPEQFERRIPAELRDWIRGEFGGNDTQSQLNELRQQIEEIKELMKNK